MSKATNRTRAFIYDVFAKCESNENFSFVHLLKHHRIGKFGYEALKRSGRVFMTKPYKWVGAPPTEEFVRDIEQIRLQVQDEHNIKYNLKSPKNEILSTPNLFNVDKFNVNDLIEQNKKLIHFIQTLQSK